MTNFQILDIQSDDITNDYENSKEFIITLYGINSNNERVVVHVKKYNPYFYIKIPNEWDSLTAKSFLKDVCGLKPTEDPEYNLYSSIKQYEICKNKEFYGVQWNHKTNNIQSFNFLKIYLKTHDSLKKLVTSVKKHYNLNDNDANKITTSSLERLNEWRDTPTPADCDSNLYESSIHPIIRFIHDSKIEPTGWVRIKIIDDKTNLFSSVKHEYFTNFKDIKTLKKDDLSDYRIASFDIECDSLHGDFPQASKNFKKLSADIFDSYQTILRNTSDSRKIVFNNNCLNNIKKLLIAGFTGDTSQFNSIWKHANMNSIKIINSFL